MHEVLTVEQAYQADRLAEAAGVESYDLMQRAGAALAQAVMDLDQAGCVQVWCGPGANGGDGYVAARVLRAAGREVDVYALGDPARLKGDAARACADWGAPVHEAAPQKVCGGGVIVDALFGAGLARPLEGIAADLAAAINDSAASIVAADLPSGIAGDNGIPPGPHVRAAVTVTFFRKKCAHVLQPSRAACGEIVVADIGIPAAVLETIRPQLWENSPGLWPDLPPAPAVMAHKHRRGSLLVHCGDVFHTGAARLAAHAGLRAGAGLVSLLVEEPAARVCAAHETEVMLGVRRKGRALPPLLHTLRPTATVIGPAGGTGKAMRDDVMELRAQDLPLVLDADALSAFAKAPELLFAQIDETCVLTPHEGEFARLFADLAGRQQCKAERTRLAAARAGCPVLLKGPDTVIAAPDGRAIVNTNAPPDLATAGSGDVLAGIIGALLAQGADAFDAAACGAWLHGEAGKLCGRGLIASDLIAALPKVLRGMPSRIRRAG